MRKHAFSIGLAVVTLGLTLGLTNLRAGPMSLPPGIPAANGRYWLQGWNLANSPGTPDDYRCFLLDTVTGQCWLMGRNDDRWKKLPMPPGLEDQAPTPTEQPAR